MKFLNNQLGFTLVQGMIIAGIVAGSSLVATRMLTDQKLAQKAAETRDYVEELHNSIYAILQHRRNCRETLVPFQATLATGNATPINISTITSFTGGGGYTVGNAYMNNNVRLTSATLGPQTSGERELELIYERLGNGTGDASTRTKQGYGAKRIRRTFTIRIQKICNGSTYEIESCPSPTFEGCYAVTDTKNALANGVTSAETGNEIARQTCIDLGSGNPDSAFEWDETQSLCKPKLRCPADQIFTGIETTGSIRCTDIENWMDFNQVLDQNAPNCPTGSTVRLVVDNDPLVKMVRIKCDPP